MRGSRPHNPRSDYVIIDNIYFYKEKTGRYYLGNVVCDDGKKRPVRAHIYVWKKHYGEIPKGYSVHHIDKNPKNNDITNLALMSYTDHSRMHALEHSQVSREHMNEIVRPMAVQWHKSDLGSDWHKQHYEDVTSKIWNKVVVKKCIVCGKEYETKSSASNHSKYCSEKCKRKSPSRKEYLETHYEQRRNYFTSKTEERICPVCGKTFSAIKYYKTLCCSPECRGIRISQKKTGVSRPKSKEN